MTAPLVLLGAGGRVGQLLVPYLPETVRTYERPELDILDSVALTRALRGAGAVLCLAGVTPGSGRPMSLNTTLAHLVLDAAAAAGCGRVLLMSSAAVYGQATGPLTADMVPTPASEYGAAKAAMEEMAADHPHPVTCLRVGNVAGADAILGGWATGFTLDVLPDGSTPTRSYIGPGTLARVLCDLALEPDLPPVMNIAAPGPVAMGSLLNTAGLAWDPRPAPETAIADVTLDTTPLTNLIPIDPAECTPAAMVQQWHEARA